MENDALVLADTNGVIRFFSPGAHAMFGFDPATAIGQTLEASATTAVKTTFR